MPGNFQAIQEYERLSVDTAARITRSYQEWTSFLTTAARLYNDVCCKGWM